MPRPSKGARLHKFKHRPYWYIRDTGRPDQSTGCASRADAEKALAAYIATKGREGSANEPANVTCGEVLAIYAEEYAPTVAAPERVGYAIDALIPFWDGLKLSHVKGETCRRYAKTRKKVVQRDPDTKEPIEYAPISPGTVRRELGVLQRAINYAHAEGYITSAPAVTLPGKPEATERWLSRDEAAKLLWAAYRGHKASHLARFILIAIYTGTRKDAILRMGFEPNTVGGWFDLDQGIMFRRSDSERQTNKRRTPARIPRQLAAHLRRWRDSGSKWAVEYQGARVGDIKRAFAKAVQSADVTPCSPHTLKHTAITWALQNGASVWDAAGFFATSAETIEKVYGHHSPRHQESVLRAVERR
ncbi:tyrosine-type recombinase/integrase [Phaeobacter gallaeciensis]|uniref:Integrase n=1 Tax=Phaeobacter gallaeciensis TaxID=60890 RepID=A0AAC9ZAC5_9RHOB|nr:tyrosine-type recombinase/integrase [Phaeobacter gallaeciensis]AHD09496.1 Integrase [Phaeobacter gallaeciensis DSM 26640]ATE92759.1 Integrase [Phaeobacter gallaeciensis]ATE97419.1 Integrase [Phaeobacter gallaeciensis]ATF05804.1 Integrase [Phaeobacter gallaeciensis]